ncbi:MAG: hypothetical protein WDO14_23225 [Bacteroidota bacterium]
MENEPVERSVLRLIHFKERIRWLHENNDHIHEIIAQQAEMPGFVDLHKGLSDPENHTAYKKSAPKKL